MANNLFILNDPPCGTERSYNALRLARHALKKGEGRETVHVFLMGDAASCAKAGQKVTQGFYNIGDILGMVARAGGEIGVCGTCLDAHGITEAEWDRLGGNSRLIYRPGGSMKFAPLRFQSALAEGGLRPC